MENGVAIDVVESNFVEKVIDASESKLVVVDFWAPWCEPCKQLAPILEKTIKNAGDKIILAKINIDENQQVAGQLRIQSIPTVLAFKNKQIVNAFQGVIPEKKIIEFLEKALGEKLQEDFSEFFESVEQKLKENNFLEAKEAVLEFIANKPDEPKAISLYLTSLIGLKEFDEAEQFIDSLDEKIKKNIDVQSSIKSLTLAKKNIATPDLEVLIKKLESKPNDINMICEVAEKYFTNNNHNEAFEILIKNYPKNKEKIKNKILEFFNALGNDNEKTIEYRKKFSQIMFS
tara:strand:- start:405 stop:1268 length:864 start_codon:yes stop_codon:yes gene_type:complete